MPSADATHRVRAAEPERAAPATLAELLERIVLAGVGLTTRALTEATSGADLTFPQWRVLVVLGDGADGATVSEVSARIGVTLPATSRQLHRLARRGLVVIARDERDRRAARARLTESGVATRSAIMEFRRREIAETAAAVTVSGRTLSELQEIADRFDTFR